MGSVAQRVREATSSCLRWGVETKRGGEGGTWSGGPLLCFVLPSTTHLARYYECICFLFLNHLPRPPPCPGGRDIGHRSIPRAQDPV